MLASCGEDGGHALLAYSSPVELAEFARGEIPFAAFVMPGGVMVNSRQRVEVFSRSGKLIYTIPPGDGFAPLKSGVYIFCAVESIRKK